MAHTESNGLVNPTDEYQVQQRTVAEQLADAQKESDELKMQLLWLERAYE